MSARLFCVLCVESDVRRNGRVCFAVCCLRMFNCFDVVSFVGGGVDKLVR